MTRAELGSTRRWVFALLALLTAAVFSFEARAQGDAAAYAKALALFSNDSFNDTDTAISGIAASGHPLAAQIVGALQDGRLLFSAETKKVLIKETSGAIIDAGTGEKLASEPAGLSNVRLNNRLRRSVEAALGTLTLMSPDPVRRLEAANAVFKSRDAAALPAIEQAIQKESDARIKRVFSEARAAIILYGSTAKENEKIEAISIIRDRGDQEARGLLAAMPADQTPGVQRAQAEALKTIDNSLAAWAVAQNFWYGLSLGSVLLLAAIGLAITFGVMGVINMAHGEMVMLGAYTTFVVQEIIRTSAPWLFDYSLAIAIPLAFLVAALVGIAIERGVIRFLYGRPLETLLATWGISLILQQAVRTAFGPTNREVGAPHFMSGATQLAGLTITWNRLWIIVFAILIFGALLAALRYTTLGLQMRAVTQNRRMASAMAINTGRIDALTFALGSGIAGLAGVALSQIDNVSPNLGQGYIIDSFLVVVFGGVGNLWGTLVGALSLGIANKFLEPYAGAVLGKILLLVAVILFIQKRPRGLFALKGRAVEA
ncbi:MAG: urea ABC transporter permease subunit UrtB [Hyphomicrobiales bacterium]|nr:MAG: urea ABC transporter permease subunit UrtB [Hyphomicrobiales bacterium]